MWVEYSYGDSFGHANAAGTEAVGVFEDGGAALALKNAIEKESPDYNGNWESHQYLNFTAPDGQKFHVYRGNWDDYFGGLDEVHVDTVLLQRK